MWTTIIAWICTPKNIAIAAGVLIVVFLAGSAWYCHGKAQRLQVKYDDCLAKNVGFIKAVENCEKSKAATGTHFTRTEGIHRDTVQIKEIPIFKIVEKTTACEVKTDEKELVEEIDIAALIRVNNELVCSFLLSESADSSSYKNCMSGAGKTESESIKTVITAIKDNYIDLMGYARTWESAGKCYEDSLR
jgi:hypothetical protein